MRLVVNNVEIACNVPHLVNRNAGDLQFSGAGAV